MIKMKKRMKQWLAFALTLSLLLPVNAFALPSEEAGKAGEAGSIAEIEYSDQSSAMGSLDTEDRNSAVKSGDTGSTYFSRIQHPDKPVTPDSIQGDSAGGLRIQSGTPEKTLPLVMIVVSFNNIGYDTRFEWYDDLFGEKDSLQDYYSVMSNGKFTWVPAEEDCSVENLPEKDTVSEKFDIKNDGIIHVTINKAHGNWGDLNSDDTDMDTLNDSLIEALKQASQYIDFSKYDKNKDGKIANNELGVGFILAGYEAATANSGTEFYKAHKNKMFWARQSKLEYKNDTEGPFNGVRVDFFIAITDREVKDDKITDVSDANTEQTGLGIVYHELGHYLGLPDFYDTDYLEEKEPEKAVWKGYDSLFLSLMDAGNRAEDPDYNSRPSAFDAWSRAFLEWVKPDIADKDGEYTLYSQESGKYNILKIPTEIDSEYYLLENRRTEGIDIGLHTYKTDLGDGRIASSNGLVLWHVDEDVYNDYNSDNKVNNTDHRPAIVPLFAESLKDNKDSFTLDFKGSKPYTKEDENSGLLPFYSKSNFKAIFGDIKDYEEGLYLPVYGEGDKADDPDSRILSSILLEFIDDDSQEMRVRISGVPEPAPEPEPEDKKDKYSSGEALSSILTEKDLSVLNDPSVSVASKNGVLLKIDKAIESRVKGKKTISFNSAVRGNNTSREYWVRIIRNRALRYDGRNHSAVGNGSGKSKNSDIEIKLYYCEKEGKYAFNAPSENTIASANGDWKEAKVKKITIKNSNKATFDYTGNRNEGIKGYKGAAYISKIVLSDKELNRTLGKGLNQILKGYSKRFRSDKTSRYTDGDLEKTGADEEKQFIIPVYPLFIGIGSDYGQYTDGQGNLNRYTVEKGSLNPQETKLTGSCVRFNYSVGNSKTVKLRFSSKKTKDFLSAIAKSQDNQNGSKRLLTATGNYYGILEY